MNALQLFRSGLDTIQIAERLHTTEAQASKRVWLLRCQEKGFAAMYRRGLSESCRSRSKAPKIVLTPLPVRQLIKAAGC